MKITNLDELSLEELLAILPQGYRMALTPRLLKTNINLISEEVQPSIRKPLEQCRESISAMLGWIPGKSEQNQRSIPSQLNFLTNQEYQRVFALRFRQLDSTPIRQNTGFAHDETPSRTLLSAIERPAK